MANRIDLKNTSRFSRERVAELVEIARGHLVTGEVALNVKNSGYAFRGRAYSRVPRISNRYVPGARKVRRLVVAAIGADSKFPLWTQYPGLKTAPRYRMRTAEEALVALLAHELTHCQQFETGAKRSEIQAELVAVAAIRRYRESRGEPVEDEPEIAVRSEP